MVTDIHERAAELLGWTVAECRSFSLAMLRDVVRGRDQRLADDISAVIDGGQHIMGEPLAAPRRLRR